MVNRIVRAAPRRLPVALVLAGLLAGCASTPTVQQRWEEILHRLDDDGAIVAGRVLDADTGRELCAVGDIDQPMKPASNMKLVVAAIALESFGPTTTFETILALDGEDLVVIGSGDPGFGDPVLARARGGDADDVLAEWADAVADRGITAVGDVVYDSTAIEPFPVHPSWWPEDRLEWYGAPVGGLNFNDNCIDITLVPTLPGQPVDYELSTPVRDIEIENRCLTAAAGAETTADVRKLPGAMRYVLTGQAAGRTELTSVPVQDPGRFLADALRVALERRGVRVNGELRRAEDGTGAAEPEVVAVHVSHLDELLARMNKRSHKLLADALIEMVGRGHDRRLGRPWGRRAVEAWLADSGLEPLDLVMVDGSGLSHDNRVTVRFMSELLLRMRRHPDAAVFEASLAVGGVDGTLRRRLTDVPGLVRAKTGTLTGASALSGYVTTDAGEELIFSIIVNRHAASDDAEALQDDAVRALVHGPQWSERTVPAEFAAHGDR
ncbi:MAG: D-alanyl-D-alanine carboxypeptidase/D-alanyl-D-alanine endopeptidase [Planctomycetota bacterium]|jgi:D-alanyl-D-alanine carboxypeptidase/D-alanyl-D-alanine-endopeptidase (penicillin-binding protein 4)